MKTLCLLLAVVALPAFADHIVEAPRTIPLVHDVDVAVAGGGVAAVAAAEAAARAGCSVFLAAPKAYLGEDLAGRLRLAADDLSEPLAKRIYAKGDGFAKPLDIKRELDRTLLEAKVRYLTGSPVVDVLRDTKGAVAGVVMANRNGRQAVRAKVVVDATEWGLPARLAGAQFKDAAEGPARFVYRVVSDEAPAAGELTVSRHERPLVTHVSGGTWGDKRKNFTTTGHVYTCSFAYPARPRTALEFAEVEQRARDLVYVPGQSDCADRVDYSRFEVVAKEVPWLLVAGALKLPPEPTASQLARSGVETGAAAARQVASRRAEPVGEVMAGGYADSSAERVKVSEPDKPLPAAFVSASGEVKLGAKELPVLADCDVVVVGGGTGGAPAAIAAARHGMKTVLVEFIDGLGGLETDGRIGNYWYGNVCGFTDEIDAGTRATGRVYSQAKAEWYRRECHKAGVTILFGTLAEGVTMHGGKVDGIVAVLPDGSRGVFRCKVAIDSTGNATLADLAGEETEFINAEELSLQGVGQAPHSLGVSYSNTDVGFLDVTDAADVFGFALRSRLSMGDKWDQSRLDGSRERRRMVGAFFMSPLDVMNGRTYPDTVVQTRSNFDTHGQTADPAFFILNPPHSAMSVNLPYRCFLPKKANGLLVTGLGISAHRDAMPILRMQPDVQNQGYVAGTAAAMAVKADVEVRDIDVPALQREMVEKKILKPDVPGAKDSYPYSDAALEKAVKGLVKGYDGLSVVMTDPARSLPMLERAYEGASGTNRLVYAHALAMMGSAKGAAELVGKVASAPWDWGWNYRGMGQFNRSVGWVDSYVIALGFAQARTAVPTLARKAGELDGDSPYSHFRALALAFERLGGAESAAALAKLLDLPGVDGHALAGRSLPEIPGYRNEAADKERSDCLRELVLARALFNVGDLNGRGRAILEAYARDPRGAYAAHAAKVLAASSAK